MPIFNENLDKTLKELIPEWLEPAIDHHMEQGITGESFAEIVKEMRRHYHGEFKQHLKSVAAFLKQTGYSDTAEDPYRQHEEQNLLSDLSRLNQYAMLIFNKSKWAISKKSGHGDALLNFRGVQAAVVSLLKRMQTLAVETTTKLSDKKYRVPPQLVKGLSISVANIIGDFQKVNQFLGKDARGETPKFNTRKLLMTPEQNWLPHMSPEEAQRIVEAKPDHGANESLAKIQKIINYGPDYQQAGEMLQLLASIWKVTASQIVKAAEATGEDEMVAEWLVEEGPRYGIDVSDLPQSANQHQEGLMPTMQVMAILRANSDRMATFISDPTNGDMIIVTDEEVEVPEGARADSEVTCGDILINNDWASYGGRGPAIEVRPQ